MGYMRHHGIFVTSFDEHITQYAHIKAGEIFGDLVSEVKESTINGYHSFAVFPDGSKEGWSDSDAGDEKRALFKAWLETQRYEDRSSPLDWVEVQYGDDNDDTRIVADSDEWRRADEPVIVDAITYLPEAKE